MSKNKRRKLTPKNEFRFNNKTQHKNYIFAETDKKYRAVGLTTDSETFGKKNMPLSSNPQKGKTDKSYIRVGIINEYKNEFGRKLSNYAFSSADFKNVKAKIRNYKKKQKK